MGCLLPKRSTERSWNIPLKIQGELWRRATENVRVEIAHVELKRFPPSGAPQPLLLGISPTVFDILWEMLVFARDI